MNMSHVLGFVKQATVRTCRSKKVGARLSGRAGLQVERAHRQPSRVDGINHHQSRRQR